MSGPAPASATDLSEFARLTECKRAAAPASRATLYNICCTICSLQNVSCGAAPYALYQYTYLTLTFRVLASLGATRETVLKRFPVADEIEMGDLKRPGWGVGLTMTIHTKAQKKNSSAITLQEHVPVH